MLLYTQQEYLAVLAMKEHVTYSRDGWCLGLAVNHYHMAERNGYTPLIDRWHILTQC